MSPDIHYSVVIPIYNEEATIPLLWGRLSKVVQRLDSPYEVIFVNDGSFDASLKLLAQLAENNAGLKVISLSRNFGHQCALTAGIDHAKGRAVILMDGDLQDAPETIPRFIDKWKEGYDVVYAVRNKRKEAWLKRLTFKLFYRINNALSEIPFPLDAGIFSLMDHKVIKELQRMPEHNRYITGLRTYAGFRQTGLLVERESRQDGAPRVTLSKLFNLAFDAIFSFSKTPLRVATIIGLFSAASSFIIGAVGLYYKYFLGREFLSWPYGLSTTFFIGGLQLFFLGIIGEYIGRIYDEVKNRPYYILDKKIGFDD
ncbi:MAG: glycosyltransferase family 2 protein [Gammaproteobacteria bacterium]|nr:glycosyltransferase family 2 protein [Gammaproteobacteria bacterium]